MATPQIHHIKELENLEYVNRHLDEGWLFLNTYKYAGPGDHGGVEHIVYVLGWEREDAPFDPTLVQGPETPELWALMRQIEEGSLRSNLDSGR